MDRSVIRLLFLNAGHFFDHLFMLIFATAVLAMVVEFDTTYGALLPLATAGFVAFGAGALPAGWLGDRWSRDGMMVVFFIGIGLASIVTGFAQTPLQVGGGLLLIGIFASIYHPVGIAMVVEGREKVGRVLGINGVFGNMGVAGAGLITGFLIDLISWRAAFIVPGVVSVVVGVLFLAFARADGRHGGAKKAAAPDPVLDRAVLIRVFAVIGAATLLGGLIFQATTVSLPKVVEEQARGLADSASDVGLIVGIVFAVAAFTQIAVGHLIDRYAIKPVFVVLTFFQVPLLFLVVQFVDLPMFATALIMMSVVFGLIPINDALIARHSVSAWRSRVYAFKYVFALGVSASAVPLVGIMHETTGFATLFAVLAVVGAMEFLAALTLPGAKPKQVSAVPAE